MDEYARWLYNEFAKRRNIHIRDVSKLLLENDFDGATRLAVRADLLDQLMFEISESYLSPKRFSDLVGGVDND